MTGDPRQGRDGPLGAPPPGRAWWVLFFTAAFGFGACGAWALWAAGLGWAGLVLLPVLAVSVPVIFRYGRRGPR